MKANRQAKKNRRGDRAEVGIGTMIVFIAAVIVAAVAAAVLINTAGNLQRKASETGSETTDEVSGNIFVRDIQGTVSEFTDPGANTQNNITTIDYYISLAPGASSIDLTEMVVRWQHGANLTDLTYTAAAPTSLSDGFTTQNVKEAEGSVDQVLEEGDRVRVQIVMNADASYDESVTVRDSADVLFIPEVGTPVDAGFSTPPSFGGDTYISLK